MREKLLYVGALALSVLYMIEVFSDPAIGVLQWVGLAICAACIVPWAVSQVLSARRNKKRRDEAREFKAFKKQQAEKKA